MFSSTFFIVIFIVPLSLLASPCCFIWNVFVMKFSCGVSCINQWLTAMAVIAARIRVTFIFTLWRAQLQNSVAFNQLSVWHFCDVLFYLSSVSFLYIGSLHVLRDMCNGLTRTFLPRRHCKPGHVCRSTSTMWWHCSFTIRWLRQVLKAEMCTAFI